MEHPGRGCGSPAGPSCAVPRAAPRADRASRAFAGMPSIACSLPGGAGDRPSGRRRAATSTDAGGTTTSARGSMLGASSCIGAEARLQQGAAGTRDATSSASVSSPTAVAALTPEQRRNTVEFGGFLYATMDFTPPTTSTVGKQLMVELPPRWELALDSPLVVSNVIAAHHWGARHLVVGSGKVYATRLYDEPGASVPVSGILRQDGTLYGVTANDVRVLMRTRGIVSSDYYAAFGAGLLKRRKFTDCVLVCDGEEISCHRAVLAQASPVFERMLLSEMREGTEQRIEIVDVQTSAVHAMLNFMYTGKIEAAEQDFISLLTLGDLYNIEPLVLECLPLVFDRLQPENVAVVVRAVKNFSERPLFQPSWERLCDELCTRRDLLSATMKAI